MKVTIDKDHNASQDNFLNLKDGGSNSSLGNDSSVHKIKLTKKEEGLIGESHLTVEKLLGNLFKFQDHKNEQMISISESQEASSVSPANDENEVRRQQSIMLQKQILKYQQLSYFKDKLWLNGKARGTISGTFRFINFPFLQQMPIGVRVNNGILFSSKPLLHASDIESKKTIINQHADFKVILECFTKLYKADKKERALPFVDAIKCAELLHEKLQCSEKQSMTSFIYNHVADLMRAQEVFIDIGEHMLYFCDFVNDFLKERYFKILTSVLYRSELDLA